MSKGIKLMKIAVAGTGYVGLSNAVLLAQHNEVVALDINDEKVEQINQRNSPIKDADIEEFFKTKQLNLQATTDSTVAFQQTDYVIFQHQQITILSENFLIQVVLKRSLKTF